MSRTLDDTIIMQPAQQGGFAILRLRESYGGPRITEPGMLFAGTIEECLQFLGEIHFAEPDSPQAQASVTSEISISVPPGLPQNLMTEIVKTVNDQIRRGQVK